MAYVAISERLRSDVRNRIYVKQQAELGLLAKPVTPVLQHDDPRILDKFWGEHLHLRDLIPVEWCRNVDSLRLMVTYERTPGDPNSMSDMYVDPTINGKITAPPRAETYYPKLEVPADDPLVADHVRFACEQYAVTNKWNKVATDVMSFLVSCKSLNEALKLWPDLRIYIPQEYLDKAEEKVVKQKAAESRAMEVLKQIDTDHAVSSAVMVRILEANKQQEAA